MPFWARCAVQMLLMSLSKTGWGTDLTEELDWFLDQFFSAWISSLVEFTPHTLV